MVKIPSALKWMMNRQARLLGEIKRVEKRFEARESALQKELNRVESRAQTLRSRLLRVQSLRPQHLAVLQQNLTAIDNAMGQHEVSQISQINRQAQ